MVIEIKLPEKVEGVYKDIRIEIRRGENGLKVDLEIPERGIKVSTTVWYYTLMKLMRWKRREDMWETVADIYHSLNASLLAYGLMLERDVADVIFGLLEQFVKS